MTPAQLRTTLTRIGLTKADAAALLGVSARTMRSWLDEGPNTRPIPEMAVRLLWLIEHHGAAEALRRAHSAPAQYFEAPQILAEMDADNGRNAAGILDVIYDAKAR